MARETGKVRLSNGWLQLSLGFEGLVFVPGSVIYDGILKFWDKAKKKLDGGRWNR